LTVSVKTFRTDEDDFRVRIASDLRDEYRVLVGDRKSGTITYSLVPSQLSD